MVGSTRDHIRRRKALLSGHQGHVQTAALVPDLYGEPKKQHCTWIQASRASQRVSPGHSGCTVLGNLASFLTSLAIHCSFLWAAGHLCVPILSCSPHPSSLPRVSCSLSRIQTSEDDLELLNFLPPPPECWICRCVPSHLTYGAGDRTQGFVHAMQILGPLDYIPSPYSPLCSLPQPPKAFGADVCE